MNFPPRVHIPGFRGAEEAAGCLGRGQEGAQESAQVRKQDDYFIVLGGSLSLSLSFRSGIPGIENMFAPKSDGKGRKKRKGQVTTCIRFPGQTIYRGKIAPFHFAHCRTRMPSRTGGTRGRPSGSSRRRTP